MTVTGDFPAQMPFTQSFDISFDLRLYKRLSKQSRRRWLDTPSHSLWRYFNGVTLLALRQQRVKPKTSEIPSGFKKKYPSHETINS